MNVEEFWQTAELAKTGTEQRAEIYMRTLRTVPVDVLRDVLFQYRYFTVAFISDIALLLARLPFGDLRSFLGRVLSEELGDGDATQSHPYLYDSFLRSIDGLNEAGQEIPANAAVLRGLTAELASRSVAYGIGLRGMGGECLCQEYLAKLWEHFRLNPYVQEHADRIDWRFWDIHTGPIDLAHVERTRALISEFVSESPEQIADLAAGYARSIDAWDHFWQNVFGAAGVGRSDDLVEALTGPWPRPDGVAPGAVSARP